MSKKYTEDYQIGFQDGMKEREKMSGKYWNNITAIKDKQTIKGLKEYGQTLEMNQEPSDIDRINYIEEEMVDALMYLEWLKEKINEGV